MNHELTELVEKFYKVNSELGIITRRFALFDLAKHQVQEPSRISFVAPFIPSFICRQRLRLLTPLYFIMAICFCDTWNRGMSTKLSKESCARALRYEKEDDGARKLRRSHKVQETLRWAITVIGQCVSRNIIMSNIEPVF